MPKTVNSFSRRSSENLLQLWRGRDYLDDDDIDPLRDELEGRGMSKEMEEIVDQGIRERPSGALPTGPFTYGNLTVFFWWVRELWLRKKTRGGLSVQATVESAFRTRSRWRSAARTELDYSYEFRGQRFTGRVIRDFMPESSAADSLAFDHHPGDRIEILIDETDPRNSYFPSGMGCFDPLFYGAAPIILFGSVGIAIVGGMISDVLRGH
jgi:hypothetical protein